MLGPLKTLSTFPDLLTVRWGLWLLFPVKTVPDTFVSPQCHAYIHTVQCVWRESGPS